MWGNGGGWGEKGMGDVGSWGGAMWEKEMGGMKGGKENGKRGIQEGCGVTGEDGGRRGWGLRRSTGSDGRVRTLLLSLRPN